MAGAWQASGTRRSFLLPDSDSTKFSDVYQGIFNCLGQIFEGEGPGSVGSIKSKERKETEGDVIVSVIISSNSDSHSASFK